jgi:hypothetical protein
MLKKIAADSSLLVQESGSFDTTQPTAKAVV